MALYILWIPNLTANVSLKIRKEKIEHYNISDTDVNYITASIDRNSWNIEFSYEFQNETHRMLLTPFQANANGFLFYELADQTESDSCLAQTMSKGIHAGVYHLIKEFFHEHNFHSAEEDSILHARFFQTIEEYRQSQTSDRDYYIKEYHKKFRTFFNDINGDISVLENSLSLMRYREVYKGYKRVLDLINRFNGEYLYYQSLIHIPNEELPWEAEEIKAWSQSLQIKKEKIENLFTYNSALFGTHYSMYGLMTGIISLIITIVTLIG